MSSNFLHRILKLQEKINAILNLLQLNNLINNKTTIFLPTLVTRLYLHANN